MKRMRPTTRHAIFELTTAGVIALVAASMLSSPIHAQTPATPPAGATAAPAGANAAPAAAAPATVGISRQSFYSDRREFVVGDIVTILIDDYTITTAIKENASSDTRSRNLGLAARLPSTSKSVGLDTRNDATQNERGSARRENRFQNEMSVRVVAVGANGLLQVKGNKNINVDKSPQDVTLTGWVRAQDISLQNTVESARLADASIGYTSGGPLGKPKQGIISKVLGMVWP
ncbi:MAG: flagellar basal body L-ring protein FlgH [Gemmatimonas sp.]